jgi:hypothetical protein
MLFDSGFWTEIFTMCWDFSYTLLNTSYQKKIRSISNFFEVYYFSNFSNKTEKRIDV